MVTIDLKSALIGACLVLLVAALVRVPGASAQAAAGTLVCEEGFTSPVGINKKQLEDWMMARHAEGKQNFIPFGVQGTVKMICAW
jgi:hypothetical protein